MSVLFLILKIIIIIIVIILAVAILLLTLILFVPICYNLKGEKDNGIILNGNASWLLGAIKLKVSFREEIRYSVKVFWKIIFSSKDEEKRKRKSSSNSNDIGKHVTDKKSKVPETNQERYQEKAQEKYQEDYQETVQKAVEKNIQEKPQANAIIDIEKNPDKINPNINNRTTSSIMEEKNKNAKMKKKNTKKANKMADKKANKKANKTKDESSNFKDILYKIQTFLKEDAYKGVVKFVTKHGWKMLKSMLPRKIKLRVHFGTNDPAVTGYVLGVVSIFYAVTGNSMVIEPDFEKKLLEGNFDLKGRIFIFILVYHALKIILDKRVKKLIAEYNH